MTTRERSLTCIAVTTRERSLTCIAVTTGGEFSETLRGPKGLPSIGRVGGDVRDRVTMYVSHIKLSIILRFVKRTNLEEGGGGAD